MKWNNVRKVTGTELLLNGCDFFLSPLSSQVSYFSTCLWRVSFKSRLWTWFPDGVANSSSRSYTQGSPVYRITWCRFPSHRKPPCELVALMPRVDFPQSFSPGTSRACRTWTEIHPDVRAFGDSCGAAVCTPQVHPGLGRCQKQCCYPS